MYEYNLGIKFQNVVLQHSERTAIWFAPDTTISYGSLNALANVTARRLLDYGVSARDVVCLSGEKSLQTFALMLGCLKIGAIYCVVDTGNPPDRWHKILSICRPRLLLGEADLLSRLREAAVNSGISLAHKDQFADSVGPGEGTNLAVTDGINRSAPAYIMFTSGSLGAPKGALITHGGVLNLIEWSRNTFNATPNDVLTNVNPLFFDNSVFDFYCALFSGASLTPFTPEEVTDPARLVRKVEAAQCSLWFSVPSLLIFLQTMKATDGKNLRSVRKFIFGGEGYPKSKLKSLFEAYPDAEFHNVYGPTECTCICSSYQITQDDFADLSGLPPLGKIADNFNYLIVDDRGKPVKQGEIGELCLSGPNVGLGYYNDAAQSAAAFVQNPLQTNFPEIMYRTGDLVSLNPTDGKLYIHGRRDNQVKHMGYRIELEEIESAMHGLDYVSEAAALHTSHDGRSRIVAVIAADREFADEEIKRDLRSIIPSYMIPSQFHREHSLPKNQNGKVDRRRLIEKYLTSNEEYVRA